jgi:maltooligosyltrehalose trehalohydrolase
LLLVSPCVPLVFMGEEYGETRPFPFFCSFLDRQLADAVGRGRRSELAGFAWQADIPDPQAPETFESAKLQWAWPAGSFHSQIRQLYADLIAARRRWPALRDRRHTSAEIRGQVSKPPDCVRGVRGQGTGDSSRRRTPADRAPCEHGRPRLSAVLVLRRGEGPGLTAYANLTPDRVGVPPPEAAEGSIVLSTEEPRYGGRRNVQMPLAYLDPYEMCLLGPREWRL